MKRYRTEIVLENMIMLDSKGGSGPFTPSAGSSINANAAEPVIEIPEEPMDDEEIRVENIPF